jgi:hypothetical protein
MPYRKPLWAAPFEFAAVLLGGAAVVAWPLAVFHGWARWPAAAIWFGLVMAVLILFAAAGHARRKPRPRRPTR